MRIRTVKPEFWQSEGLGQLSREVRMLAVALLNWADDDGYFRSHPALIAGALLPFDADGKAFVSDALPALQRAGFVDLFEGGVGQVVTFVDHQVINKPTKSKLAAKAVSKTQPLTNSGSHPGALREPSHAEVEVEVEVEQGSGTGKWNREVEEALPPQKTERPVPLPRKPDNPHSSAEAFFAHVQHQRASHGLVTEKLPHTRKLSAWWNEVGLELGGAYQRLDAAYEHFSDDRFWADKMPAWPFHAFISGWRKYVPRAAKTS